MKLEQAAVRPALDWRLDYFTVWPHVKNLVPAPFDLRLGPATGRVARAIARAGRSSMTPASDAAAETMASIVYP